MYITNLIDDFYELLTGKRLLLMVNYDIDSICTCKIFQQLLKYKHILYTLTVIRGVNDMKVAFNENSNNCKHFILINCGGTIDIVELFEPDDDVIFFVLDSHKPTDLCNIYSNGQVRLLTDSTDDDQQVPVFHDVFREESDDEEDNVDNADDASNGSDDEGNSSERVSKRRRLNEADIIKRRERRLWEENRNKLLFEYSQFSYYSKASSITMFNLSLQLNQDNKNLLWLAIIGVTEQLLFNKIEYDQYVLNINLLQSNLIRINNRTNNIENNSNKSTSQLQIFYENDLRLVLYRHWSVEESIKYSMYTASNMKLWSYCGNKNLYELLAEMGLPLAQSRQSFRSMDLQLRKEFLQSFEKLLEKYNLDDLIFTSFTLQYGYKYKYCASDIVYILLSILELNTKEKSSEECFNLALDCLKLNNLNKKIETNLNLNIEKMKQLWKELFKIVQSAIDRKQIIKAGPFIYYLIQDNCFDSNFNYYLSNQHILLLLAQYLLKSYCKFTNNRKIMKLPLIVSVPKNYDNGTCIIIGIPPLCENSSKNFFGKAFEQAAERINCDYTCDFLDTSYFEIYTKDRTRFLDALTTLLI